MNRTTFSLFCCVMFSTLYLTGCKPSGYSSGKVQSVTEEYADDAKAWFDANMPEAKPVSAEAYADGIHLYALINGKYSKNGTEYEYFYDCKGGQMYTGEAYLKSLDFVKKELADTLGVGEGQIELYPADWHIATESLDDRDPDEYVNSAEGSICTGGLEVLPWDADAEEWGKKMVCEGLDDGEELLQTSFAMIYVEAIPLYDQSLLRTLAGISSLDYIQPVADVYDGICREDHAADSRTSRYIHLEEWEPGVNIGYSYVVKESFDENGNRTEISDPFDGKNKDMQVSELGGGRIAFSLPNGADALLLIKQPENGKEYTDEYKPAGGEVRHPVWHESSSFECKYMPGGNRLRYEPYSIVLPESDARLYYRYEWGPDAYYDFSVNIH